MELEIMASDWDAIFSGDKPFLVWNASVSFTVGDTLELTRVDFGYNDGGQTGPTPTPYRTPNREIPFVLVRVTCVTPPGSYGISHEHQVVGIRRLGF